MSKNTCADSIFGKRNFGFGLMRLPLTDPDDDGSIDIGQFKDMVDTWIEAGFTYFDTAYNYCKYKSEIAAREALVKRYPRESFTLTDKLHASFLKVKEDKDRIFNEQLEKCGVDYFDYYLVHGVGRETYAEHQKLETFEWLREKRQAGLVRHMGLSFHDTPGTLERILTDHPYVEMVQIQLNYLDYNSLGVRSGECLEVCRRFGKPAVVMEPLKGGLLVRNVPEAAVKVLKDARPDMSLAEWGYRFAAGQEGVGMVLTGSANLGEIRENAAFMKDFKPLSEEENGILMKALSVIEDSMAVPCTGCAYCAPGCPQNIPIPRYFSLYNADKLQGTEGGWSPHATMYERMSMESAKASECIGCGQCESMCPQHIKIIDELKNVAARFEKRH